MITAPADTTEHEERLLLLYLRMYRLKALAALLGFGGIYERLPYQSMRLWFRPDRRKRLAELQRQADEIRAAVIELEGLDA